MSEAGRPARGSRRTRARPGAGLSSTVRFVILCSSIALAGVALYLAWARHLPRVAEHVGIPFWLVALGAAIPELFVIRLQFRRDTVEFLAAEIVLVLALYFADPATAVLGLVLGRVCGRAISHAFESRTLFPLPKLVFGITSTLFEACVAIVLFHQLLGLGSAIGPAGWAAAFATTIAVDLLDGFLIELAMLATGAPLPPRRWRTNFGFGIGVSVATTGVTLVGVTVLWWQPGATWLLLIPLAVLGLAYRALTRERPRHDSIEFLYDTTGLLQRSSGVDALLGTVLSRARDVFRAEAAELVLFPREPGQPARRILAEPAAEGSAGGLGQAAAIWQEIVAGGGVTLVDQRSGKLSAVLAAAGLRDAMVAPLHGDTGIFGVMLVANRRGGASSFRSEELQLLEMLANHVGVAMENARLVGDLEVSLERLRHQALHDALTGLANRVLLVERIQQALARARRGGKVGVLLVDLDGFKQVNDGMGHAAGDELLRVVADRIRACIRASDTAGRLGGDEFAVLLDGLDSAEEATGIAGRLVSSLRSPVVLEGAEVFPQGSVGVAISDGHADADAMLRDADAAMYAAKAAGKGRFEVFERAVTVPAGDPEWRPPAPASPA